MARGPTLNRKDASLCSRGSPQTCVICISNWTFSCRLWQGISYRCERVGRAGSVDISLRDGYHSPKWYLNLGPKHLSLLEFGTWQLRPLGHHGWLILVVFEKQNFNFFFNYDSSIFTRLSIPLLTLSSLDNNIE